MSRLLAIFLICLSSYISYGQSNKDVKRYNIQSIEEINTTFKDGEQIEIKESFVKFDKKGNEIEIIDYNKVGGIKSKETAVYNRNNDKIERVIYDSDGVTVRKKITYTYNSVGKKIEESVFDKDDILLEKIEFIYNGFGDRVEEKVYSGENKLIQKSDYLYDKNGLKINRKDYNENNEFILEKKWIYKFLE